MNIHIKSLLFIALFILGAVLSYTQSSSVKYIYGTFVSVVAVAYMLQRYYYLARGIGDHVGSQAKTNSISTAAMWGRIFIKSLLYMVVPAFILTAILVCIALLIAK